MSLEKRRHQENRKKKKVAKHENCVDGYDPKWIGKRAATPTPCSCSMCGNPRKHAFGRKKVELSMQEKRQVEDRNYF